MHAQIIQFKQHATKTSIKQSQEIWEAVQPFLHLLDDPIISAAITKLDKMVCDQAREAQSAHILATAIHLCTKDILTIGS